MISPSSLSAFSASVTSSLTANRIAGAGAAAATQVKAQAPQPPRPQVLGASPQGAPNAGAPPPGQVLPRGSLLDLSV
jgi:hypothetical protein